MKTEEARRTLLFTGVTLLIFLVPLLLLGEWMARVRYRQDIAAESKGFDFHLLFRKSADPELVHELIPGAEIPGESEPVVINSEGFRDDPFTVEKPEGVFRILLLGDSVAWGYGVDTSEAFPQRLEKLLNEDAPPDKGRIEVLNLAVMGYSTAQEARLLETRGVSYSPDLVLLAYVLNDADEVDGGLSRYFAPPRIYLLDAWRRFNRWWAAERIGRTEGGGYPRIIHTLYREEVLRSLDRLQKSSTGQGFPLWVAQIPAFSWQGDDYPEAGLENELAAEFSRRGFGVHPLRPAFRERSTEEVSFDFWHPNLEGHAIIARDLARSLRSSGVLPAGFSETPPRTEP